MKCFLAALVLAVTALLAGCGKSEAPAAAGAAGKPGLAKIRFQTDWYPQAEHGGFYQALAKGFYEEAGLDVEILAGGPGATVSQKMISSGADIAMGRSDDIIDNAADGLPFVMVGVFMQHDPQGILVHADSPVTSFKDLDGKTIMATPGANWIDYLKARYGISFNLIPHNYGLAQFMADKNFIQQCFVTNEPYFVGQNGGRARALLIASSGYDPYRVIYTTQRFAREHPDLVRAFVAASLRGWEDFMANDPRPAKRLIAERNSQMPDAFMDFSIAALREQRLISGDPAQGEHIGQVALKRLEQQVATLAELKLISAPVPLEKFARTDLMPPELVVKE